MSANLRRKGLVLGNLSPLRGVLREWQNLNEDPIWRKIPDLPWWFNERAVLSQFAGAVWRHPHGWVFEEYSTWRYRSQKKRQTGRGDIWFRINNHDFVGEAKQCWPVLSGKASSVRRPIENMPLITLHSSLITLHFFIMPPSLGAIATAAHAAPVTTGMAAGAVE